MRKKELEVKNKIISFLEKVPIYPDGIKPRSLGIESWNLPAISFLIEDDDGNISFMSNNDKQKAIRDYLSQ